MRTPIRKPPKYARLPSDAVMTEKKFKELKDKLHHLKKISRPSAAAESKRLAEMGDLSDNAAYSLAKGRLRGINQSILDLEEQLRSAVIIQTSADTDHVQLGHRVTLEGKGQTHVYHILGSSETNPRAGVISHVSPLGALLLGRKVGDIVTLTIANKKQLRYTILRIE